MDMDKVGADVAAIVSLLEPVLAAAVPPAAGAMTLAMTIANGVLNEVPAAIAAYEAIRAGSLVTPVQLVALYADEQSTDAELHAAITAQQPSTKPGAG